MSYNHTDPVKFSLTKRRRLPKICWFAVLAYSAAQAPDKPPGFSKSFTALRTELAE
jgi:hypothetical protein